MIAEFQDIRELKMSSELTLKDALIKNYAK
jgi:hypothetical protein